MMPSINREGQIWPLVYRCMSVVAILLAALESSRVFTLFLLMSPLMNSATTAFFGTMTLIKYIITMSTLWYLHEACACAVRSEERTKHLTNISRGLIYIGMLLNIISIIYFWMILPHRKIDIYDRMTILVLIMISQSVLEMPAEIFLFVNVNKIKGMIPGIDDLVPRTYSDTSSRGESFSARIRRCYSTPANVNSCELHQINARSISENHINIQETSTEICIRPTAEESPPQCPHKTADMAVQTHKHSSECIVIVVNNK